MNILSMVKSKQKISQPVPSLIWQNPWYFLAFGLGSGAIPFAPGTFGTLLAIPFYLLVCTLPLIYYALFLLVFIVFSSLLSEKLSREINIHDHPGMNIDEFAGFFVTMFNTSPTLLHIVLGFMLFRFFDILKPWPISYLDKNINNGFGMILDDVVAGIFAAVILQLVQIYW